MIILGRINLLRVVKEVDFGLYLDGGVDGEILIPKKYVPEGTEPEQMLEVFIYLDSEDRLIATTQTPYVMMGQFASLTVKMVNQIGAFLDWGLLKDLLVPHREQSEKMLEGQSHVVYVYEDTKTGRIVGTSKIDRYVSDPEPEDYEIGEELQILVAKRTDLGYKCIIKHKHWGQLYFDQIQRPLHVGTSTTAYVKAIRPDGKIDLILEPIGHEKIEPLAQQILEKLKAAGGTLPHSDKTDPEIIKKEYQTSKKNFKKAIGDLYKKQLITITENDISLI